MKLTDFYFQQQDIYEQKYGSQTLLLMEVGSFFELYSISNDKETVGPDMKKICDILNIQMTRKNSKNPVNDRSNPYMAGFPNYAIDKFIRLLIKEKYTVVVIEQDSHGVANPKREVSKIYSPGTDIDYSFEEQEQNGISLLSIFVDEMKGVHSTNKLLCAFSGIHVSTAYNCVGEYCSQERDFMYPIHQISEYIHCEQPKEIILSFSSSVQKDTVENIKGILDTSVVRGIFHMHEPVPSDYIQVKYQNTLLSSIFEPKVSLPVTEYLGIHRYPLICTSYVQLLKFAYEHDNNLVKKLDKPELLQNEKVCSLHDTAIYQLNLVSTPYMSERNINSLWSIVNRCKTGPGKRLLRNRLIHPIYDTQELQTRYDSIDTVLYRSKQGSKKKYEVYQNDLQELVDLEKVSNVLQSLESDIANTNKTISEFCDELNIKTPF